MNKSANNHMFREVSGFVVNAVVILTFASFAILDRSLKVLFNNSFLSLFTSSKFTSDLLYKRQHVSEQNISLWQPTGYSSYQRTIVWKHFRWSLAPQTMQISPTKTPSSPPQRSTQQELVAALRQH